MKTILVTGIAGFIGSQTAQALLDRGDKVVGIDSFNDYYDVALKRARAKTLEGRCAIVQGDIADLSSLEKIASEHKIDQICHLAAQAGVRYSLVNPFSFERSNLLGTLNLLELCRQKGIPSFVYASSSSVYGANTKIPFSEEDPVTQPTSLYAATKRANELMAHSYHHIFGLRTTGLRFFTVYGPWGRPDMAYFSFTRAILEGKPIDVFNQGKMRRDFTFVSDIVAGVLAALDKDYPCEIFNLGNSQTVELMHLIECLEKELGRKAQKAMKPMQLVDVPETCADISKSKKMLGFEPKVKIEEGLNRFIGWYKKYYGQ